MFDVTLFLTYLAILAIGWLVYLDHKWHSLWKKQGVPGPRPWPITGTNIYYLIWSKLELDLAWHKRYGSVYGLYQGYEPILRVNNPELASHIMIKDFNNFNAKNTFGTYSKAIQSWVFFETGSLWHLKRLMITPMFSSSKLENFSETISECILEFQSKIGLAVGTGANDDDLNDKVIRQQINVNRDSFLCLALDILCRTLHSAKLNTYHGTESEFHKRTFAFGTFDIGYWIIWMLIPKKICKFFELDQVRPSKFEYVVNLGLSFIHQRRREGKSKPDIVQAMIEARIPEVYENIYTPDDDQVSYFNGQLTHTQTEEINRQHKDKIESTIKEKFRCFTDLECANQMAFLFIAGFDTTSASLSFIFTELARRPNEQEEVYQQIASQNREFPNAPIKYKDLAELTKLDAFISEVLRLLPPVTDIPRRVTADQGVTVTLPDGRSIYLPNETNISINPYLVHRDDGYWRKPSEFDMSRFYKENKDDIKSGSYLPFGIGPRNCAGFRFAIVTLKQTVSNILAHYKVEPATPTVQYSCEETRFINHPFFLQLKDTRVKLIPRNTQ